MADKDELTLALEDIGTTLPRGTSMANFNVSIAIYQYDRPWVGKWFGTVTSAILYVDFSLALDKHDDIEIAANGTITPFRFNRSNFNDADSMRAMLKKLFTRASHSAKRGGEIGTNIRFGVRKACLFAGQGEGQRQRAHSANHSCLVRPGGRLVNCVDPGAIGVKLDYIMRKSIPLALKEDPIERCLRESNGSDQDLPYEVIYARKKEEWDKLRSREVTAQP